MRWETMKSLPCRRHTGIRAEGSASALSSLHFSDRSDSFKQAIVGCRQPLRLVRNLIHNGSNRKLWIHDYNGSYRWLIENNSQFAGVNNTQKLKDEVIFQIQLAYLQSKFGSNRSGESRFSPNFFGALDRSRYSEVQNALAPNVCNTHSLIPPRSPNENVNLNGLEALFSPLYFSSPSQWS